MARGDGSQVVIVTGTDTGVGKTIATAALAAALRSDAWGRRDVAVYKPVQTGVPRNAPGDVDEVRRLTGLADAETGICLDAPMAPVAAAGVQGVRLPSVRQHATRVTELTKAHDVVLVEGAGGVLVELDEDGADLTGLAAALDRSVQLLVVCRSGLGTLNHTLLTLEALARRGVPATGLVVGSWPADPTLVETTNLEYLSHLSTPCAGVLPDGASRLAPALFRSSAPGWFTGGWSLRPARLP